VLGGSRGLRAAVDRPIVIVVVLHRTRHSAMLSRGAGAGHRVKHHLPHTTHTHRQITAPGAARRYAPADDSSTVLYRFAASASASANFRETKICVSPLIQKSRRISHISSGQRAYTSLGSCSMAQTDGQTDRRTQTDGSRYSKMPHRAGAK